MNLKLGFTFLNRNNHDFFSNDNKKYKWSRFRSHFLPDFNIVTIQKHEGENINLREKEPL